MKKITATGFEDTIPEDAPTLYVSGGRGNTDRPEVHLEFVDGPLTALGWFVAADLLAAITDALAESLEDAE